MNVALLYISAALHANYRVITHLLAMTSYALDFIVYCLLNRYFREATSKLLTCQTRRQRRKIIDSTSSGLPSPDDVIKRYDKSVSCGTNKTSVDGSTSSCSVGSSETDKVFKY